MTEGGEKDNPFGEVQAVFERYTIRPGSAGTSSSASTLCNPAILFFPVKTATKSPPRKQLLSLAEEFSYIPAADFVSERVVVPKLRPRSALISSPASRSSAAMSPPGRKNSPKPQHTHHEIWKRKKKSNVCCFATKMGGSTFRESTTKEVPVQMKVDLSDPEEAEHFQKYRSLRSQGIGFAPMSKEICGTSRSHGLNVEELTFSAGSGKKGSVDESLPSPTVLFESKQQQTEKRKKIVVYKKASSRSFQEFWLANPPPPKSIHLLHRRTTTTQCTKP